MIVEEVSFRGVVGTQVREILDVNSEENTILDTIFVFKEKEIDKRN